MNINTTKKDLKINEVQFRNLTTNERVNYFNEELKHSGKTVDEAAKELGLSSSTVSLLMRKDGYRYCRMTKQYIQQEEKNTSSRTTQEEFLKYLFENEEILRKVIGTTATKRMIVDESIYYQNDSFVSKTLKIKGNTFKEFQTLLKDKYPQYRMQDMLTQALIDFIHKYK
ncbi:hypothetical protein [Jeotgalibacillus terrae]|uniref:Uncharacterized protein n=1 Tax=Jeotgalibacillus terrae TaxID=587735 RepID=A0ABW5ZKT0_9BACL|nr:hypothetical protein [Jeotgalibacillus terrae]MBM7578245.1 uncharacterized membrane-anchored protein YjiN (DUF445 family) [Jeotgalibacillus terrae]